MLKLVTQQGVRGALALLDRQLTRRKVNACELASRSEKGSPLLCLLLIIRFRKLPGSTARAFFPGAAVGAGCERVAAVSFLSPAQAASG